MESAFPALASGPHSAGSLSEIPHPQTSPDHPVRPFHSTQNTKEIHIGIQMLPSEFPERRRDDPKRGAEARVFDAL